MTNSSDVNPLNVCAEATSLQQQVPELPQPGRAPQAPPTPFSLHVRFTGLCAFVPAPDLSRMRVVLANARDHAHHGMPEHHAVLVVHKRHCEGDMGREVDFEFKGNENFLRQDCYGFILDGEDITISPTPSGSLVLAPGPDASLVCPTATPDGFYWILRMEEAGNHAFGDMRSEYLKLCERSLVLARVKLTTGRLRTSDFSLKPSLKAAKWQFYEPGSPPRDPRGRPRAIAEQIEWVVDFRGESTAVDIKFDRFHAEPIVLTLAPKLDAELSEYVIRAWIVNMPLVDIISSHGHSLTPDLHFAHFYDLSMPGTHVPHPVSGECPAGTGNLSNPRCPPALFNANNDV
jgi:hypothetical protein